jgi:hypothetical protein
LTQSKPVEQLSVGEGVEGYAVRKKIYPFRFLICNVTGSFPTFSAHDASSTTFETLLEAGV